MVDIEADSFTKTLLNLGTVTKSPAHFYLFFAEYKAVTILLKTLYYSYN